MSEGIICTHCEGLIPDGSVLWREHDIHASYLMSRRRKGHPVCTDCMAKILIQIHGAYDADSATERLARAVTFEVKRMDCWFMKDKI